MVDDHFYKPGFLNGKCARRGCGRPVSEHSPIVRDVTPQKVVEGIVAQKGNCPADHNSIETALLIGDGGLQWRACPICGEMVEPKLANGELPVGLRGDDGPGRGAFTKRQTKRLLFIQWLKDRGRA